MTNFSELKLHYHKAIKVVSKLAHKIMDNRIDESAAALAFYLTLATFPALIALIAILAYMPLFDLEKQIVQMISENIPGNAGIYIINTIQEVLREKKPTLLSFGFITALWLASSGMTSIISQLNYSFRSTTNRGFVHRRGVAIGLTLIYVLVLVFLSVLILVGRRLNFFILDYFGLSDFAKTTFFVLKYIIGFLFLIFSFSTIYYLAPGQKQKYRFSSLGAVLGSFALVLATVGFNFYISNFANYNQIYGSLGGIIIYMFWLYISGYILLIGAEINSAYYDSELKVPVRV